MKNGQRIILGVMSSILILLFSIVGCSDPSRPGPLTSYTGSMLTPLNVDDYLTTIRGGTYCIHKDTDSSCIDLIPLVNSGGDTNKGPIIHIYPERTVYLFYHEGKPIVRVERIGDTTDIVNTLGDPNQDPNGDGGDNGDGGKGGNGNGDGGNGGNGDGGTPARPSGGSPRPIIPGDVVIQGPAQRNRAQGDTGTSTRSRTSRSTGQPRQPRSGNKGLCAKIP